jgi:hypothetical protein
MATEKAAKKAAKKATQRVEITQEVVNSTVAAACLNDGKIYEVADTQQTYLTLRRRNRSVHWLVRTRRGTRTLGKAGLGYKGDHLNLREARQKGREAFAEMATAPKRGPKPTASWTWADCVRARLALLAGKRAVGRKIKLPSTETQTDVRSSFGIDRATGEFVAEKRPSLAKLQNMKLVDITAHEFGEALRGIAGIRPREKFLTYAKAMLGWAYSNSHDSGFVIPSPWWTQIEPPQASADELNDMEADGVKLRARKVGFRVQQVGDFLARHEAFCAEKVSNEKVSPGVRWGIWWVCLTANRRGSTTLLERGNVQQQDPLGDAGWGTGLWDASAMKAKKLFMLPVPPIGLHAINTAIADWQALIAHSHSAAHTSKWVFASTRRVQRDGVGLDRPTDISVHPSSLADHIRNMYGRKPKKTDPNPKNWLEGLDLSLHIVRTAATHYLENLPGLSAAASSAFLGHEPPLDERDPEARSPTTEKFYSTTQRMPLKKLAMQAWSEAVMEAYYKAGGKWPEPYPPPKYSK